MAAVTTHPSFPQPSNAELSLWRYMDLSKYASLLQKRALVFPRTDKLGDPFEGSVPDANARYYSDLRARLALGEQARIGGVPDTLIDDLEVQIPRMRRAQIVTNYISCWHMNVSESAGMWKLYSKSSDAVCVRTNYASLADVLPSECFIGKVRYLDFSTGIIDQSCGFAPLMAKRRSFEHEHEVRAIIWDTDALLEFDGAPDAATPTLKVVPVDLDQLVKGVHVSPEAPDWFRDVVADLTIKYGLDVPVLHSELNGAPLY